MKQRRETIALRGRKARVVLGLSAAALSVIGLAACGSAKHTSGSSGTSSGGSKPVTIGTTDQTIAVDPAGSYDFGSLLLETNIYQFLKIGRAHV